MGANRVAEIEVKVRVEDPSALKTRLVELGAKWQRDYHKRDQYYRLNLPGGGRQDVRIRMDMSTSNPDQVETYLTFKEKTMVQGIEVSTEHETSVGDATVLEGLLLRLGCTHLVTKEKLGSAYSWGEVLAELSRVEPLGWFLELEVLVPYEGHELSPERRDTALGLIAQKAKELGYTEGDYVVTPYTVMLMEANKP